MELRGCSHQHFIQAVRGGVVIKVLNMNHRQMPALSFKLLKDICESIDSKAPKRHSDLPKVDRTLREIKAEIDEFVPDSDVRDNDLDDATTLKQLKDRFPKRKRKFKQAHPEVHAGLREIKSEIDESVPHPDNGLGDDFDDATTLKQLKKRFYGKDRKSGVRKKHPMLSYSNDSSFEKETSLSESIIGLKSMNSSRSKANKESVVCNVDISSTPIVHTKTKQNCVSEGSQQVGNALTPFILVKVKEEAKELESPRETSLSGKQSFCSDEVSCARDEVSSGIQTIKVQPEIRETLSSMAGCQICVTNEMSYDHLENIEPISVFVPAGGINGTLKSTDLLCHEVLEEISEQNSSSCVQNIDMVRFDDKSNAGLLCEQDYSLSNANNDNCPSHNCVNTLKADGPSVTVTPPDEQHQELTCTLDDMTENGLTCRTYVSDLLKDEKQALESLISNDECQYSTNNQSSDCVNMDSTVEPRRPPERLLSTRKAISPSSQEQLCSAMKSDDDLCRSADQYNGSECKGQLQEVVTCKKALSKSPDIQHARNAVNHVANGKASQRRVYISSRNIIRRSLKAKANLEVPCYSRVLPNLSTECGSIQGCSERAIAFSQRQMQDMESLTFKLMDELKSMKSIIEQKLLFEAYRNVSFKSDVDEVKSTIRSASKMEETAQKWLSMMAQDCKRFCKIMKLTPNSPESRQAVSRKRRKIVFADEAGEKLCHIKYFEAGGTSPVCDPEKQ